jgi:hypothetical protein
MLETPAVTAVKGGQRRVSRPISYPNSASVRFDDATYKALMAVAAKRGWARARTIAELVAERLATLDAEDHAA